VNLLVGPASRAGLLDEEGNIRGRESGSARRTYPRDLGAGGRYDFCMNAPMFGSWSVQVSEIRPFAIHGDPYYELLVSRMDNRADFPVSLKVAHHAFKSSVPKAGDRVHISFLAGQVTSVKIAE
jgi:hypothetical protein